MLFIGDDWAEDHHDIAVMDEAGRVLAQRRLTEGVAGLEALHDLLGGYLPGDAAPAEVLVGIETDRGPWVQGLLASGYTVYAINPAQSVRYRQRTGAAGAKSDKVMRWYWPGSWPSTVSCTGRLPPTAASRRRSRSWPGLTSR